MHWSHGLQHLRHKRPTFAFTSESGHTLGSRRKIAHSGSHGETGAFSPSATAGLCVASEIAPITTFATLDSAMLLYTYISRFSVNPHCQQREKIRQSCRHKLYPELFHIAFFNFSHKWPTFAFTSESGYTLGFTQRIAHKGTHGETGVFRMRVVSLPSDRSARSQTPPGRVSERQTLPLLGLGRVYSRRTQRAFGTAMRLCASLFRGVAAQRGCVIFFRFCRNCGLYTLFQIFFSILQTLQLVLFL